MFKKYNKKFRGLKLNKEVKKVLNEVFGFSEFREGQEEIVMNLLKKRDVLAIILAGFGKSLCYYVFAILKLFV